MNPAASVTGLILCGGAGSRMGGADKGLMRFHGEPLVDIALRKLQPQISRVLISANRNMQEYGLRGVDVIRDPNPHSDIPRYDGPLAGILGALREVRSGWLMVVPCDCPLFPEDIVGTLAEATDAHPAGAYVRDHPTFAMVPASSLDNLETFLSHGGRKLGAWLQQLGATAIDGGPPEQFRNLNSPEDLPPP